ncbi:hypothetical protein KFK09_007159 [Dendrobium nobile]|uniref:Reverse transcriptase domain-containing protein n=1 Tax=Dendrobium nobile TaxID=94219 RepID=A0A8T3BVQ0_DENNO|nr:hypothetical protein KFK09_007159 [Dendrobium nobile]
MVGKHLTSTDVWANYKKALSVPSRNSSEVFNGGSKAMDLFNNKVKGFKEKALVINEGGFTMKKAPISVPGKGKGILLKELNSDVEFSISNPFRGNFKDDLKLEASSSSGLKICSNKVFNSISLPSSPVRKMNFASPAKGANHEDKMNEDILHKDLIEDPKTTNTAPQNNLLTELKNNNAKVANAWIRPWLGQVIGLDKWSSNFNPNSLKGISTPLWIRLPNLPLHCWDEVNICRIASLVGKPYLLDGNMFQWSRREFARICVRVPLDMKLPNRVWVEGLNGKFFQKILYEGITNICSKCGFIDHKSDKCIEANLSKGTISVDNEVHKLKIKKDSVSSGFVEKAADDGDGNWTLVNYGKKRHRINLMKKNSLRIKTPIMKKIFIPKKAIPKDDLAPFIKNGIVNPNSIETDIIEIPNLLQQSPVKDNSGNLQISGFSTAAIILEHNKFEKLSMLDEENNVNIKEANLATLDVEEGEIVNSCPVLLNESAIDWNHKEKEELLITTAETDEIHLSKELKYKAIADNSSSGKKVKLLKELKSLGHGAKKVEAALYLKEIIKDNNVLMVGLMETKIRNLENSQVLNLLGNNWDYFMVPSNGLSGGLMILWRKDLAEFSAIETSPQFIFGSLNIFNKSKWLIANVYGSINAIERKVIWESLEKHCSNEFPMVVGGDFNCILSQEEKRGGKKFSLSQGAIDMKNFLINNDLHEVEAYGPKFTWCNNKLGGAPIMEKLDRCFINSTALNCIQIARVKHLARIASDHCPILMEIFKPAEAFDRIIRTLKALYFWSKAKFKNLNVLRDELKIEILELQNEEAEGRISDLKFQLLKFKINELNITLARLNSWWKQSAKAKWMEEGDSNSSFFHAFANARRNINWISNIKNNSGFITENPIHIQEVFYEFFNSKWRHRECSLLNWPAPRAVIPFEDHSGLDAEFTKEELQAVVFSSGKISLPALMFRYSKAKSGLLAIKIYMEQAYDSMGWQALRQALIHYNFPIKFRELLMQCVLDPKYCILINGKKTNWIQGKSGFRQACPLSPYLFILCAQILSDALHIHRCGKGISITHNAPNVSHLFYADDFLIFSKAIVKEVKLVKKFVSKFCDWTGQKVNSSKSLVIFGKYTDRRRMNLISSILKYKVVKEFLYLGVKITLRRKVRSDFHNLMEVAPNKLNTWGKNCISLEGKLVLVKYAFLSLPMFLSSISLVPLSILKEFDKMCRSFIWNKSNGRIGLHYVSWDLLCKAKNEGGRGLFSAVSKVGPLQAKFAWEFLKKPNSLLNQIIKGNSFIIDGNWNLYSLEKFFGKTLMDIIIQIPIEKEQNEDQIELLKHHSGKSIAALCSEADSNNFLGENHWNWVKSIKLRPSIELFWWRLYNNAIPSGEFLLRRKISTNASCPRGCTGIEDKSHIVANCSKLKNCLLMLNNWGFNIPVFEDFNSCLDGLVKASKTNPLLANMYCTAVFIAWKIRCKLVHGKSEESVFFMAANTVSLATVSNFIITHPENWDTNQLKLFSSWYPPPTGWIKINIDASLKSNNLAGIGGIIRDNKGRFLSGFGHHYLHWDIAHVELLAVYYLKNILKEWMLEAQGVIIERDNSNIIKELQVNLKNWKKHGRIKKELAFIQDFNQPTIYSNNSFHVICSTRLHSGLEEDEGAKKDAAPVPVPSPTLLCHHS